MIAVSAGHYPSAPGACYDGICENEIARSWLHWLLVDYRDVFIEVPNVTLKEKIDFINRNNCELAVEIHFNSAGGKGAGCETLYYPGSEKGRACANIIHKAFTPYFTPNRGVKEGWYRMDRPGVKDYPGDVDGDEKPHYFLRKTSCPAVIVEPEFIHNYYTRIIDVEREVIANLAHRIMEAAEWLRTNKT